MRVARTATAVRALAAAVAAALLAGALRVTGLGRRSRELLGAGQPER